MKIVHLYDEKTFEYKGPYEAQESPLEEGVYITPLHSTEAIPLPLVEGKYNYFNGDSWEFRDDTRGIWYKPTREQVEINDLLEPVDATWSRVQFPLTIEEKRALLAPLSAWQIRRVLTQTDLRQQVEDAVLEADQDTQDAWHYASNFRRDDAILNAMAVKLGLSDTHLDSLFELGVTL